MPHSKWHPPHTHCLTRTHAGGIAVWEFKTKWGSNAAAHFKRPLLPDLRQVALYGFMLWMQTGLRPERLHVRYATVNLKGTITVTTHAYAFEPSQFRWVLRDALRDGGLRGQVLCDASSS